MALQWYVVHAYSGFENQVKRSLEDRIKRFALDEKFGQILVPTEEVIEMRDGQKRKSDRKFFPGYVLVQMEMDESSWHLVKDCPKVMGFIGGTSDKPTPITETSPDHPQPHSGGDGEAQTQSTVRGGRGHPGGRRPVHRFQRRGRGSQLREEPPARSRVDFWALNPGRTRIRPVIQGLRRIASTVAAAGGLRGATYHQTGEPQGVWTRGRF